MSAITDYVAAVNTSFDAIEAATAAIGTSLGGVADDITYLKGVIDQLQQSGGITEEEKALLAAAQTRTSNTVAAAEALKVAVEQLDAATSRPVPPV